MSRRDISLALRHAVLKRDHYACMYCGARPPFVSLQVDHYMPVARGGLNEIHNLITACSECNSGKSDSPPDDLDGNTSNQWCRCLRPTCHGPAGPRDYIEAECRCKCHGCDSCGDPRCSSARLGTPCKVATAEGEQELLNQNQDGNELS